jgi:tetrathionate reductase subunit B
MSEKATISRRDLLKTAGAVTAGVTAGSLIPAIEAAAARGEVPRWVMIMDLRRCTGCRACTIACKAEYDVPLGVWQTVVSEEVVGTFPNTEKPFMSRRCNHCEGNKEDGIPPCVKICPEYPKERQRFVTPDGKKHRYRDGATYKRPDGLILLMNEYCTGCGKCIEECPYGARAFNPRLISGKDSTKNGISKCSSCQHRIDQGVEPACSNICPNLSRIFGDANDPESEVAKLIKEFNLETNRKKTTLLPGENTVPMIYYIDPKNVLQKTKMAKENLKGKSYRNKVG